MADEFKMDESKITEADATPGRWGRWFFEGHLLSVWGIALSNILLDFSILWTIRYRSRLVWRRVSHAPSFAPLVMYALALLAATASSKDSWFSLGELGELPTLLVLPLGQLLLRGERDVRRLYDSLIVMTTGLALHGLGQYVLTDAGPVSNRIRGLFSHYMTFAGVLLIGLVLALARLTSQEGRRSVWRWLSVLLIAATLFLTLTRSAWLAGVVAVLLVLWFQTARRSAPYLLALVLLGAGFYWVAPGAWKARITSVVDLHDPSNYDRLCMIEAATYMVSERPLLGIGPGMVSQQYPIYRHASAPGVTVPHLHNTLVQLAAERGLLTLIAYVWLMWASAWYAWCGYRRAKATGSSGGDLYLGVVVAVISFNVAGLFEANWADSELQRLILFVIAVPFCLDSDISV